PQPCGWRNRDGRHLEAAADADGRRPLVTVRTGRRGCVDGLRCWIIRRDENVAGRVVVDRAVRDKSVDVPGVDVIRPVTGNAGCPRLDVAERLFVVGMGVAVADGP